MARWFKGYSCRKWDKVELSILSLIGGPPLHKGYKKRGEEREGGYFLWDLSNAQLRDSGAPLYRMTTWWWQHVDGIVLSPFARWHNSKYNITIMTVRWELQHDNTTTNLTMNFLLFSSFVEWHTNNEIIVGWQR